jgi:hypothetical protein
VLLPVGLGAHPKMRAKGSSIVSDPERNLGKADLIEAFPSRAARLHARFTEIENLGTMDVTFHNHLLKRRKDAARK